MIFLEFHEHAEKELLETRDYYDGLVSDLGKKFIYEIEYVLKLIKENLLAFPKISNDFRRALSRKFPFLSFIKLTTIKFIFLL